MRIGRRWLSQAIPTCAVTVLAIASQLLPSHPVLGQGPITEIRWFNWSPEESWQPLQFTVPNPDPTQLAYGGGLLRLYDVHLVKMFEISLFLCQRDRPSGGYDWSYEVANGNRVVGRFRVSCGLVRDIATAYGLGKLERTVIRRTFNLEDGRSTIVTEEYSIPAFNLTGSKIQRWAEFAQQFKPLAGSTRLPDKEITLPLEDLKKQIGEKTQIPLILPSAILLPPEQKNPIDLEVKAEESGYQIGIYLEKDCREDTCFFGSIEAKKGGEFSPPVNGAKDTYRKIQLAGGIAGVFLNRCGDYCTALVEWKSEDILYRIVQKNGMQPALVKLVNAAIEAGPR